MTFFNCEDAPCNERADGDSGSPVQLRIEPREKDLGEFTVRRVLPAARQRMVGPFVFFDHMGPAIFPPGKGIDVRPHPHIGIATITYLFAGEILHRDSLGVVQAIHPGAVNLMTAGNGIVHSERPGSDLDRESELHGIQSWIALPTELQEIDADFTHYPADTLPQWEVGGATLRLIMGEYGGRQSPVQTYSRTLYADIAAAAGAEFALAITEQQQALYVAEGSLCVGGDVVEAGVMVTLESAEPLRVTSESGARAMLVGGDSLGERHMYWNFVSDSIERIDQAKDDWRNHRFPAVPDDDERIPLPDEQ